MPSPFKTVLGAISLGLALQSHAAAVSSETRHYYGSVIVTKPDGSMVTQTSSLVKRTVAPNLNQIVEAILQPARTPQSKPKEVVTTLSRQGQSHVFSAVDDAHTFSGELIFSGNEWAWDHWEYKIKLLDGSSIQGSGEIDSQGLKTQKTFIKSDGSIFALIKEDLALISEQDYDRRRQDILAP